MEKIVKPHPLFYAGMARVDRREVIKAIDERENLPLVLASPFSDDLEPVRILNIVSEYLNISVKDIMSSCRNAPLIRARHWAMFLMRRHLRLTLAEIGKVFSYKKRVNGRIIDVERNHATIIHATNKIEGWIEVYPEESQLYEFFKTYIN